MITAPANFTTANANLVKKPIYLIEITGYATKFTNYPTGIAGQQDWLESIGDLSMSVSELDGGADLNELVFVVQDRGAAITAAFPSFVFEGKAVTLKTGFIGMAQADFCLLFTGVVDHVDSANSNGSYQFTCVDNKAFLDKVIYGTADDGFPTDSDHRRTLNGHPLDILITALENEVGLAPTAIDLAKIQSYRDGIYSGVTFKFSIDSPPSAKEFLEAQIMKPLGGALWTDGQGRVTVNFMYPSSTTSVMTLDTNSVVGIPEAKQTDLVNVANFRFDRDVDGKYQAEAVEQYAASIAKYGQYGQQVVDSDGMRSAFGGFYLAAIAARLVFGKYGLKPLKFEEFTALWTSCVLEYGDIVAVTHAKVPDRSTGTMGIVSKKFVVMGKSMDFQACVCRFALMDGSFLDQFGQFKITANTFLSYPAETAPHKAGYMFQCNDSDLYSNGDPGKILG